MSKAFNNDLFFSRTLDYLDRYLVGQCGKSEHTVRSYRDALTVFRRFLLDEKGISIMSFAFSDCTRDLLLDFMSYMKKKGLKETTCNQRLAAIRAYLWYAADGDIKLQPVALSASRVPFLREPKLDRPVIGKNELAALLAAPPDTKTGLRDRTILILLYDSAIRLEELLKLRLSDLSIDNESPYLRIHGKGDKERIVAITEKTCDHIRLYLKHFHRDSDNNQWLFYTVFKEQVHQMSPGNVERLINKYADMIRPDYPELPDRVHPHMFRRTRATNLYQDGVELDLVSRILGHSSTMTTRIYAMPSLEMLREAMEHNASETEETPLWLGKEEEMARLFGLR